MARVRTGCLTCRGRRRKCDEAKPVCDNCVSKNLTCRYGQNFTFVEGWNGSSKRRRTYTETQDVDDSYASALDQQQPADHGNLTPQSRNDETPSPPRQHPQVVEQQQTAATQVEDFAIFTPGFTSAFNDTAATEAGFDASTLYSGDQTMTSPPVPIVSYHSTPAIPFPSAGRVSRESSAMGTASSNARRSQTSTSITDDAQDFELLSYYRYHVAPLLDLDSDQTYWGLVALQTSGSDSRLRSAIYAVASCLQSRQKPSTKTSAHLHAISQSFIAAATDASQSLHPSDLFSVRILLSCTCLVESPPRDWLMALRPYDCNGSDVNFYDDVNGPKARLWARIYLSALLLSPSTSNPPPTPELLKIDEPSTSVESNMAQWSRVLNLLKRVCVLQYSPPNRLSGSESRADIWQSIWQGGQAWYAARTEEMKPLLDLSAPQIDDNDTVFTVVLFSSPSATLSNMVFHLVCLLLLRSKPRFVGNIAGLSSSLSLMWHMERILGIATTSVEDKVWDPLQIAAVIKAAERLSNHRQLGVAARILQTVTDKTGMPLDEHISTIQRARQSVLGEGQSSL